MSKKLIALCDGHGMETAGKRTPIMLNGIKSETGNFMHENEFNRAVVKYLKVELERNGFATLLVAPTDADIPLATRVKLANAKDADLYISVHANANTSVWGDWGGIETFAGSSSSSKKLASIVHKYVMQGVEFKNRGVKDGSHLYVLRKTNMPSILLELGFMDSKYDFKFLLLDSYRRECAVEVAKGICEYFGVTYKGEEAPKPVVKPAPEKQPAKAPAEKPVKKDDTYFRVVVGSFKARKEADERVGELKCKKVDAFVMPFVDGKTTFYRVVAGSFAEKANAQEAVDKLKKLGFESFLLAYKK